MPRPNDEALQTFLKSAPGASQFREFGLGFNPKLIPPAGSPYLPYYGYGDAVVRLSLGDSTEIGGAVRGGGVRWLFFPDTDVTVAGKPLVSKGHLVRTGARLDWQRERVIGVLGFYGL